MSHTQSRLICELKLNFVLQLAFIGLAVIGGIVLYKVFQGSSVEGAIRDTKGSIKGTYNEAKGSVRVSFLACRLQQSMKLIMSVALCGHLEIVHAGYSERGQESMSLQKSLASKRGL